MSQGKVRENVIHKLKFNQSRIKILLNFSYWNYPKIPFWGSVYKPLHVMVRLKVF